MSIFVKCDLSRALASKISTVHNYLCEIVEIDRLYLDIDDKVIDNVIKSLNLHIFIIQITDYHYFMPKIREYS